MSRRCSGYCPSALDSRGRSADDRSMRRRTRLIAAGLAASAWPLVGCGDTVTDEPETFTGSGQEMTLERAVDGFDTVVLASDAVVTVDVGVEPHVTVTTDDNLHELITSEVEDGDLTIGVVDGVTVDSRNPVRVGIGVPALDAVVLAGSGDMTVRGIATQLHAESSGSGRLTIGGIPDSVTIVVNGSGPVDATMVTSASADAEVNGSGDILLGPVELLDAHIAGSGSVLYAGAPAVTSRIDGSGRVTENPERPPSATSTTEWHVVPAPALEGNLLDDPAELPVAVWLPPSYAASGHRYPVVYFLAGYDEAPSIAPLGAALDDAIAGGDVPEVIAVGISGQNSLGGSFYVDSPVTGGWATAVHRDLVQWVDAHFRTVADADGRVIAGFSMGGFGAFDLAMRHPDVFGAVYALSPGALAPGALEETEMFADDGAIESYLEMDAALASGDPPPSLTGGAQFALAYGSAFAPDVDAGEPWVAYPFVAPGTAPDPAIWAQWEAGYGGIDDEVATHRDALASLRGIALDVGTEDPYRWIPEGTRHLVDALRGAGIDVRLTTYTGGHGPVGTRLPETLIPFLADMLASDG